MSNISIEYSHIYTNQHISEEHELSLDLLSGAITTRDDTSLVVMVDDYSFPDPTFDYDAFGKWLDAKGYKPDLMIRESQLIPACDTVLNLINDVTLKNQITDYVKVKKYPCSLFIATWYLVRLGKIELPGFPEELKSENLLNILPESFKPFEDKGLEIIKATQHSESANNIEYKFIPGRLIA
jgi:hypothetical protein